MPIFLARLLLILLLVIQSTVYAADKGLLWKIEAPNGKISHLLGTIHTDDQRVTEFSPQITKALEKADVFMMETLPPPNTSFFMLEHGSVADTLSKEEIAQVVQLSMRNSLDIQYALHMKPWLLAVVFDLPKSLDSFSMDEKLFAQAISSSKDIRGLESNAEHFSMLDSISLDDQLVMLRAVLKRSQEDKERDFENLIKTYQSGDLKKISDLDESITGGMLPKELWERMKVKLIDERNQGMAAGLINNASENSVFAAVGAAHLGGEDGLLNRLRNAGFKVSSVRIN
jgi:uncharacterized protein YbaP (TraB family)